MNSEGADKSLLPRWRDRYAGVSMRDLAALLVPVLLLSLAAIWAALWFLEPAPPSHITITAGPHDSLFRITAAKYRDILARSGVKLQILSSGGSLENLRRLADPAFRVDVGFVQGGVAAGVQVDKLVSLGSVFHQPLLLFYRAPQALDWLSDLGGKRLAIGPEGSGTRELALTLLKANGIEPGGVTTLLDLAGDEAAQALVDGKADAAFLMGDSAALPTVVTLLRTPGVRLLSFKQADAYTRQFRYLN
ncbi:MAG: ABC transporter substrate-binding protein, partial [Burkholderiales bacterium]|nr:ABC transporter substrate-binding protein [Burkholderiales bacterium]